MKPNYYLKFSVLAVSLGIGLSGCVTPQAPSTPDIVKLAKASKNAKGMPGVSGMAAIDADSFLVVHDAKAHKKKKERLGLLKIDREEEKLRYTEILFPSGASSLSSDLEGACSLPSRAGEFLVNESGTWEGNYGRLFHIKLSGLTAELISENKLPFFRDNNPNQNDGDQYEGLACAQKQDGSVLVILGERGGTTLRPSSILRWGRYDPATGTVNWDARETSVTAPDIFKSSQLRSITGLDIDKNNRLWASASIDSDTDLGPFRSLVYQLGTVYPNQIRPIVKTSNPKIWISEGLKVEAVETAHGMSIGSEDENFGGIWRMLPDAPTQP